MFGKIKAYWMSDYDIETIDKWTPPEDDDVRLLGMPNIPRALFQQAPRNLLGQAWWDEVRKECYKKANRTCMVCGKVCNSRVPCHAHEVYKYDFKACKAKFVRLVCLCPLCHCITIHSGRAITMYKRQDPSAYSRIDMIGQISHSLKLVNVWNLSHPHEEPIRVSTTLLEWAKTLGFTVSMPALFEHFDIKFAQPYEPKKWGQWTLEIEGDIFESPYKTREEWEKEYGNSPKPEN